MWENKADFDAKLAKLAADAKAAEGKVTDLDSFKAVMGDVGKDCGGCHRTYRKRT
ncbi:MAG: cytochrome c [Rhizobiales bacterium]|nr:cytochrome c [Hyphomicrobiales bacterium]